MASKKLNRSVNFRLHLESFWQRWKQLGQMIFLWQARIILSGFYITVIIPSAFLLKLFLPSASARSVGTWAKKDNGSIGSIESMRNQ